MCTNGPLENVLETAALCGCVLVLFLSAVRRVPQVSHLSRHFQKSWKGLLDFCARGGLGPCRMLSASPSMVAAGAWLMASPTCSTPSCERPGPGQLVGGNAFRGAHNYLSRSVKIPLKGFSAERIAGDAHQRKWRHLMKNTFLI